MQRLERTIGERAYQLQADGVRAHVDCGQDVAPLGLLQVRILWERILRPDGAGRCKWAAGKVIFFPKYRLVARLEGRASPAAICDP
jgi:hypothetical protein